MGQLVGDDVEALCEPGAVHHLPTVPEGVAVGAGELVRAVPHGRHERHASPVDRVAPEHVAVEVVRVPGVDVRGADVRVAAGEAAALGEHRRGAGRVGTRRVARIADPSIPSVLDLRERQRHRARVRVDEHELVDGRGRRGDRGAPHEPAARDSACTEQGRVVDPQLGRGRDECRWVGPGGASGGCDGGRGRGVCGDSRGGAHVEVVGDLAARSGHGSVGLHRDDELTAEDGDPVDRLLEPNRGAVQRVVPAHLDELLRATRVRRSGRRRGAEHRRMVVEEPAGRVTSISAGRSGEAVTGQGRDVCDVAVAAVREGRPTRA